MKMTCGQLSLCLALLVLAGTVKASDREIRLTNATVLDFVTLIEDWEKFKSALAEYLKTEQEFFKGCNLDGVSANTVRSLRNYEIESAKKFLDREIFQALKHKARDHDVTLIGVGTADPCGHEYRTWVAVRDKDSFRVLKDFIIVN